LGDSLFGNRIGGAVSPWAGARFESLDPAHTGESLGSFPDSDATTVDAAVAGASRAQREWVRVPMPERAERIAACAAVLADRKMELAQLVAREVGKVLVEASGDVQEAVDMAAYVAGQGRGSLGDVVASELAHKTCWTTRSPVGVAGLITPWNFPVAIPAWKVFPALLMGNAVVVKPSELAPACCDAFVQACIDAGIPAGLLNVVHGGAVPGAAIATHPGVRAVSFTGSVATGRRVATAAAETGPRLVSLELGGKNAMVVFADADIDLVLDGALFGAFGTAGQRCTSTSRLLVERSIASEVVERLVERVAALRVGDPLDADVDIGPVIDAASWDRIDAAVSAAVAEGAKVRCGGERVRPEGCEGAFYAPTVLDAVRAGHTVARTEIFGPVLAVVEFDGGTDDVAAIVNDVPYGLSAAVYTRDISRALQTVERIDTGIVYVNAPTIGAEIHLPFGGTKHTGNGFREAGRRGLEQFSETKTVYVDYSGRLQRAQIDNRPQPQG